MSTIQRTVHMFVVKPEIRRIELFKGNGNPLASLGQRNFLHEQTEGAGFLDVGHIRIKRPDLHQNFVRAARFQIKNQGVHERPVTVQRFFSTTQIEQKSAPGAFRSIGPQHAAKVQGGICKCERSLRKASIRPIVIFKDSGPVMQREHVIGKMPIGQGEVRHNNCSRNRHYNDIGFSHWNRVPESVSNEGCTAPSPADLHQAFFRQTVY